MVHFNWATHIPHHVFDLPTTSFVFLTNAGTTFAVQSRHGSGDNDKRIWTFSTYNELADAMRLRGAMLPWLYTLARIAHDESLPFLRPMWFDLPELLGPWTPPAPPTDTCAAAGIHTGFDAVGSSRSPTSLDGLLLQTQVRTCLKNDYMSSVSVLYRGCTSSGC